MSTESTESAFASYLEAVERAYDERPLSAKDQMLKAALGESYERGRAKLGSPLIEAMLNLFRSKIQVGANLVELFPGPAFISGPLAKEGRISSRLIDRPGVWQDSVRKAIGQLHIPGIEIVSLDLNPKTAPQLSALCAGAEVLLSRCGLHNGKTYEAYIEGWRIDLKQLLGLLKQTNTVWVLDVDTEKIEAHKEKLAQMLPKEWELAQFVTGIASPEEEEYEATPFFCAELKRQQ